MTRSLRRILPVVLFAGLAAAGVVQADPPDYVLETVREAKARAVKVPAQARALADLAWPQEANPDPQVQSAARDALVLFGQHALPVLRQMIPDLDPLYQADAVAAFIEARYREPSGMPPDFLPCLEETIWYGSPEAQRIALNEILRYVFPPAVLSSIDAAYENPVIARYVVNSLGRMRDPRARLFLSDLMLRGADFYKGAAARALERFGENTMDKLRAGVNSDDRVTRESALRVFLPHAEGTDLELLKGYLAKWLEDDPELIGALRRRVDVLERRLAP